MATSLHIPQPPLSDYVSFLWLSESHAEPHTQERRLPTGTMDLVICLDEDDRMGSGLSGAHSKFFLLDTSRSFTMIGVVFKPGGGFPFVPMPAGELHNLGLPLDAVWGRYADAVRDQLLEAKTSEVRFRILERALLEKCAGLRAPHPAVGYALKEFEASAPSRSIADVTQQIGLSSRRFIEIFRDEVGLTPKLFRRIRRFQKVLDAVENADRVDWARVALSCGYFDQAHFIHDFRAFAGVNPSTSLRYRTHRNRVAVHD